MFIGIDVGGTNLKGGIVDSNGNILKNLSYPLESVDSGNAFISGIVSLCEKLIVDYPLDSIQGIGIGIPGAVRDNTILYTCNIPLENVPIGEQLFQHFHIPVYLENDANCAAIAEWMFGAGKNTKQFALITLGTGVGGGFIINGKPFTGGGMVGEVGHMVIHSGGELCNCGRRGCWEKYASAGAVLNIAKKRLISEKIAFTEELTCKDIFDFAASGNQVYKEICKEYSSEVACGIVNLINILQPECVAIGGGVADAPEDLLLKQIEEIVSKESYEIHVGCNPVIVKAHLGNTAGIVGAAMLSIFNNKER